MDTIKKAKNLWDTWDIRFFILSSLFIQVFLTFLAPLRKSSSSSFLRFFIWLFYLTADAVGIFVIGLISSNKSQDPHKLEILAFWAPFLLLHLGGPDTITALALEDNELWNRHALQLGTQLIITIYVFIITFRGKQNFHLFLPTIFMVMDGVIKYLERTSALFFASADSFRDSLVSTAEPGPNYARLMEEYFSAKEAHIPTNFEGTSDRAAGERKANDDGPNETENGSNNDAKIDDLYKGLKNDEMEVIDAHHYFELFKAILADGFMSLKDRKVSRDFFMDGDNMSRFNIIQIELNLIYDTFYTKLFLLQRKRAFLRVFCFFSVIGSLVYFSHTVVKNPKRYWKTDIAITFVLLGVAMVLDICSLMIFVMSDWWIIAIPFEGKFKRCFKGIMLKILIWSRWARTLSNRPRWSESISGYNVLRRCFRDPPFFFDKSWFSSIKRVRDLLIGFLYVKDQCANEKLLKYVVEKIHEKAKLAQEIEEAKEVCSARGNLVFENDYYLASECLSPWTVDIDYDESLLIWHLATDFCYWTNSDKEAGSDHRDYSKVLSDYMSYILLRQQTMVSLVVGMADTRFVDTCADAKKFISDKTIKINWCKDWWGMIKSCCSCCCGSTGESGTTTKQEKTPQDEEKEFFEKFSKKVLEVKADVQPIVAKGDKSKSVLFDACRLAKQLEMFGEGKWEIISKVWVEMLCYAAVRCSPRSHISRLNKGGELITLVWLYMAHLGLGERFLQNQGFGWTKLIIKK